jgi:antagonist of KipI
MATQGNTREPLIKVIKPGWLTTIQDLGRPGYQHYGMPVTGVMDRFAAIVANRLVGNPDQAAVLECTGQGPELLFQQGTYLAVTGANLSPTLNGHAIALWQGINIREGDRLSFGPRRVGFRCYLAVTGGFDVPVILGSRSTHCPSQTGGLEGRPLRAGDHLYHYALDQVIDSPVGRRLPLRLIPRYDGSVSLRVILDVRRDFLHESALTVLTNSTYTVAPQSDRTGYRLSGPPLARTGTINFISEGTVTGALQVPPDGQPILLMADRQTTGGYPPIATVITVDLSLAAQLGPGDTVRFVACSIAEAQALLRTQSRLLNTALPPVPAIRSIPSP